MGNTSIARQGDELMPKGKNEKAMDHKKHMKLQRDKEQKRKQKKQVSLPVKHLKGKK